MFTGIISGKEFNEKVSFTFCLSRWAQSVSSNEFYS